MYILYYDLAYEPYFARHGSLEDIKKWIEGHPHVSPDELSIYKLSGIDIYELTSEVRDATT